MITKNWGMLLLGVYLIVVGAILVLGLTFPNMLIVQGVLALLAGIFIIVGR